MSLSLNPLVTSRATYSYTWWDGLLSPEVLDKIVEYCQSSELTDGKIIGSGTEGERSDDLRKSKISMIHVNNENRWMFDILAQVADHMNNTFYQFDLVGFDHFQYTVYEDSGDKYDYHVDMTFGDEHINATPLPRKLSLSICLNDPSDYEGGQFEFLLGGKDEKIATQAKGRVLAFPSYILHRVTPITKGTRKSIVIWVLGNKFK